MSLRDVGTVKDTTTITLYHPATGKDLLNADKTPMTITLHGPYSERYKSVLRDQQQRRMTDMTRAAARTSMTPEEVEALSQELLIRCIEDWSITLEGDEKLAFSVDAVESVMAEFPWLKDQVNAAMGNVADFLEPSKKH
jgi:molecular chaperone DnaK (HSP70)